MGMSAGGGGSSFNPEPNMTPMIDVLLVLLIIFMLIIPMARKTIDLQLPEPNPNQTAAAADNQQIVLEVSATGEYRINTQPVPPGGLEQRLREIYSPRPDKIIFVKGDTLAKYQTIIQAMDIARGAGVVVIGVPPKDVK